MAHKDLRVYIFEILLILFLLFTCLFERSLTRPVIAVILLVCMVITLLTMKNNKTKSTRSMQITILMSAFGVIFVIVKYIIGAFVGFYKASVILSSWSILNYIIPYIAIIVSTEIMRKAIILKKSKKEKLSKILFLIMMVMMDISLLSNIHAINSLKELFNFVAIILFPSIANNLLYNFIANNFKEEKGIIIYRILTNLYIYIIPIIPNIDILLESIFNLVIPSVIYVILTKFLNTKKEVKIKKEGLQKLFLLISGSIAIATVMLVSCKFKYGALVIATGSMTGTIDKGDIIIYKTIEKEETIEKGDIIVFYKDDMKIIHRVIAKRLIKGQEVYYTKGDANQQQDNWYSTKDDIIGKYILKIPYIGGITLNLYNLFN